MSLTSVLPALAGWSPRNTNEQHRVLDAPSNATSSVHSKKSKSKYHSEGAENQKSEAKEKTAREREEPSVHLYDMWSKIQQEEKDEHHRYLKERVSIQHELIKRQDALFRKHQVQLERKRWQAQEAKRLSRMAKSNKYTNFVRDVLAQDRKKTLGLKSHTRVISSHQPVRVPVVTTESRSSLDNETNQSPGQNSLEIGSPTVNGMSTSLLADNFSELLLDPVEVQLHKLLGVDAESFLHPTFREGAKKTLNPVAFQRKLSGVGAKELWATLRSKSRMKLEMEDDMIPVDVKNAYRAFLRECYHNRTPSVRRSFCKEEENTLQEDRLSESQLIQDIKFTRHRLELMYRVAHMNRDKTRLLVKTVNPGDPAEETVSRPPRYNPQQILANPSEKPTPTLPMLALTDTEGKPHPFPASRRESVEAEPENDRQVVVDGERIKFLTEEMAKCEGEFSKRHNAPGCSSEMTPASQGPSREETLSAPPSSAGTRDAKRSQAKKWEPLTLSALLEYRAPLHVPGCGDFLFGKSKTWKLQ